MAFKDSFKDRQASAAAAKKAIAEKFKVMPGPDDPAVMERNAARQAISDARDARMVLRKLEREADLARLAEEEKARQAAELVRQAEEAALAAKKVIEMAELEVQRKAARDARYAARKARR